MRPSRHLLNTPKPQALIKAVPLTGVRRILHQQVPTIPRNYKKRKIFIACTCSAFMMSTQSINIAGAMACATAVPRRSDRMGGLRRLPLQVWHDFGQGQPQIEWPLGADNGAGRDVILLMMQMAVCAFKWSKKLSHENQALAR